MKKKEEFKYSIKEIEIDKDIINRFVMIETQRSVRKSQVERLEKAFLANKYLTTTPIHANLKNNIYRIIDGAHRTVAIKNLIEAGKLKKTTLTLAIYNNLSTQQERDLYDLIAKQVPQNVNDFISLHRIEFPLWNLIEKKSFPSKITIYGSKDSLQFKTILYMLNCIKRKRFVPGSQWLTRDQILSVGRKTEKADYDLMARFTRIFMASYGAPGTANKYSKMHIIMPLFHIWYVNKKATAGKGRAYLDDVEWVKRFERIMSDPEIVLHLNSIMNRETVPRIRQRMIELMQPYRNKKDTKYKLK